MMRRSVTIRWADHTSRNPDGTLVTTQVRHSCDESTKCGKVLGLPGCPYRLQGSCPQQWCMKVS